MPTVTNGRDQTGRGVAPAEREHDVQRQHDAPGGRGHAREHAEEEQARDTGTRKDPAVGGQGHARIIAGSIP